MIKYTKAEIKRDYQLYLDTLKPKITLNRLYKAVKRGIK